MVRKIIVTFSVLALVIGAGLTAQAETYDLYSSNTYQPYGNVENSRVIELAKAYLNNLPFPKEYVLFRQSESEYILIYGDGEVVADEFRIEFVDATEIWFYCADNWSNSIDIEKFNEDYSQLTHITDGLIYSNLEENPTLIERGSQYEVLQTILLVVLLLSFVLHALFRPR